MPKFNVTKTYRWTFYAIEADNVSEAERIVDDRDLSGADLIWAGYDSTETWLEDSRLMDARRYEQT